MKLREPRAKKRRAGLRPPPRSERARRVRRAAERAGGRRPGLLGRIGRIDERVLIAMRTTPRSDRAERGLKGLAAVGEFGAIWTVLGAAGAALEPAQRQSWIHAAAVAPASVGLNYLVKLAVGRSRPVIEDHPPLGPAPSKLSFPSAHSTSSFAGATAISRMAPPAAPAVFGLAGGIAASRPFLGMHYPSDVLAGVTLGLVVGRAISPRRS